MAKIKMQELKIKKGASIEARVEAMLLLDKLGKKYILK